MVNARYILIVACACWMWGAPGWVVAQTTLPSGHVRVVVTGLRNNHGRVGCGIFGGPDGFPRDPGKQFAEMHASIQGSTAICDFADVPAGTYAATVLHDENEDDKMDFNWMGIPTKGYGFSNDAKATLSPPSFEAASFVFRGVGTLDVPIKIVYW
jgi:uncharacterized protein (DUF2141 family)